MRVMRVCVVTLSALLSFGAEIALAQSEHQNRVLVVNGQTGEASVVEIGGRAYVDLAALARIGNGSLQFDANRIVLTLPVTAGGTVVTDNTPAGAGDGASLSRDFMRAGVEEIALMREWASPLANAIQNGYPVTDNWVAGYRDQAAHGLRMASVAATTDGDRNALQLLKNEFDTLTEWSNKLLSARKSLDAGKYAVSPTALRDDPLSQKIIACGRFLGTMLVSGTFQDEASCH